MTPLEALKRYFGYDSFRPGQEALIDHVDRRRSTAYIELEMFGRRIKTKIGLGVVAKKSQPDDVWGDNQV